MLPVYMYPGPDTLDSILKRKTADYASLYPAVQRIFAAVEARGDSAVREFTREFDQVEITDLAVGPQEQRAAAAQLPETLKEAVKLAAAAIDTFHRAGRTQYAPVQTAPGVVCWKKSLPVNRVGLYVPGGTAPLFSTVLMLAVPARIAGCRQVSLCTPPRADGTVHPAILYAAGLAGVTRIYRAGGAQAVAAMSLGTETIPKCDKLFGPGNTWVTAAKVTAFTRGTAIDMPAGPSEVMIIADETADPAFAAADLLSQAEHGPDSQAILVTTSQKMADRTAAELEAQQKRLPRTACIEQSLRHSMIIVAADTDEMLRICNAYAPEHLIISARDAAGLAQRVENAGSVFIGRFSPESAGDYCSGTNHTLPTGGAARAFSGLSAADFCKEISFQELSPQGLRRIGPAIIAMAQAEELQGHARAAAIRLERLSKEASL